MSQDALPLAGRRIAVTRAAGDGDALAARLAALGALPILCPAIAFGPPPDPGALDAALVAKDADWVVFTSATGVRAALDRVRADAAQAPAWSSARVAAIGPSTASALRERGVAVDFVPESFVGEALGDTLPDVAGRRVLLLRAEDGRDVLRERLAARGADVRDVSAYSTVAAPLAAAAAAELDAGVDAVAFSSASTVDGLVAALGGRAHELLANAAIVSIGPVTSAAVRAHGLGVAAEADQATMDGVISALVRHFAGADA